MIRLLIAALIVFANAPQVASREALAAPRLKELVTVTAEVVRIGDLVDNAGAAAGIAVFRAPDLGETGAVDVARIAEALRPHRIVDLDTAGLGQVVVTRLSRAIPADEIEQRLVHAFTGHYGLGDARNLAVTTDRPLRALHVEASATGELAISRLHVEQRTGRFDVHFELMGSSVTRRAPLRITGTVSETVETAVLARALARGDTIKASDVVVERRRKSEFLNGVIPAEQATGFAARRAMRIGEVLRANDLMKAETVRRNETVTIVYQLPGIMLTVRGKALEAGTVGDTISVTNIQSKRTVQATVEAPGRVSIAPPLPIVAAAAPLLAAVAADEVPAVAPAPALPAMSPMPPAVTPRPALLPSAATPAAAPLPSAEALALSPMPLFEPPDLQPEIAATQ